MWTTRWQTQLACGMWPAGILWHLRGRSVTHLLWAGIILWCRITLWRSGIIFCTIFYAKDQRLKKGECNFFIWSLSNLMLYCVTLCSLFIRTKPLSFVYHKNCIYCGISSNMPKIVFILHSNKHLNSYHHTLWQCKYSVVKVQNKLWNKYEISGIISTVYGLFL
jgi:hypothetical protein